jgi:hypothetical protein
MLGVLQKIGFDDVGSFGDSTAPMDLNGAAPATTTDVAAK